MRQITYTYICINVGKTVKAVLCRRDSNTFVRLNCVVSYVRVCMMCNTFSAKTLFL